ncbi:MAG: type II toxin-antitoxin system HicA family toxin [Chloroflexi bacterium]|nr:type II toxin-antitoxin system HicA family toxin [Chloroflexota bacterium]
MRLPRDVSGDDLARRLARLGYEMTRQTGSHLRLTRTAESAHHITIPRHSDLRVGTLDRVLKDVARHLGVGRDDVIARLWER